MYLPRAIAVIVAASSVVGCDLLAEPDGPTPEDFEARGGIVTADGPERGEEDTLRDDAARPAAAADAGDAVVRGATRYGAAHFR